MTNYNTVAHDFSMLSILTINYITTIAALCYFNNSKEALFDNFKYNHDSNYRIHYFHKHTTILVSVLEIITCIYCCLVDDKYVLAYMGTLFNITSLCTFSLISCSDR